MSWRDFQELPIYLHDGNALEPAIEVLERARALQRRGENDVSAHLFLALADSAVAAGFAQEAQDLINEVTELFRNDDTMSPHDVTILRLKGEIASRLGRRREASSYFEEIGEVANKLNDRSLKAYSEFSLGNQAFYSEDLETARKHYRSAFEAWSDSGDYFNATRSLLNLASLSLHEDKLDAADAILRAVDNSLKYMRHVPSLRFSSMLSKGQLEAKRGNHSRAADMFRRALRYARASHDLLAEITSLQNLGAAHTDLHDFTSAIRWFRKGLRLAESLNAVPQLALLHRGISGALGRSNRFKAAEYHLEQSQQHYQVLGDARAVADINGQLGAIAAQAGDLDRARQLLGEAIQQLDKLGDLSEELRARRNLLLVEKSSHDPEAAEEQAAVILTRLPPTATRERAETIQIAAQAWLSTKPPSIDRARKMLSLLLHTIDQDNEFERSEPLMAEHAAELAQAAAILRDYGGYEAALEFFSEALSLYEQLNEREMAFHVRNDRAIALTHLARFEEARFEYDRCLEESSELENRAMELQASFNLGEMAHRKGNFHDSIAWLRASVNLAREIGDQETEATALGSLGIALLKSERWEDASEAFQKAGELARTINDLSVEATALGGLAGCAFAQQRFEEAADLYQHAVRISLQLNDWQHAAEDLRGLLESLAILGRKAEFEHEAQVLVNLTQDTLYGQRTPETFVWAAKEWLRKGELEEAADCYAIGLAVFVNTTEELDYDELTSLIGLIAYHLTEESIHYGEMLAPHLRISLDRLHQGLADILLPTVESVLEIFIDQFSGGRQATVSDELNGDLNG